MHPITQKLAGWDKGFWSGGDAHGKGWNALHAFPEGFGAGMTVAFTPQEAAGAGNQAHHLAQGGVAGGPGPAGSRNSTSPSGSLRASRSHSFSAATVVRLCFARASQSGRLTPPSGGVHQRPQIAFPIRPVDQPG